MNQALGSPTSPHDHLARVATSKVTAVGPYRVSKSRGVPAVTTELPTWLIALPIIAAVVVVAAPSVEIIARNLRRAGSAGVVGGVSSTVIAITATQPDAGVLPVIAVVAGAASTAAAGYLAHPERTWFGKRLSAARFKRTDVTRTKTSKRAHRSLGNAPVKRTNVPRVKRG
jgi:uncharacterized membrane protein